MLTLIAGLVIFLGIHSVRIFAPALRDDFIAKRGEIAWKLLYSILSIAGFVLLIWGYGQARLDNVFFYDGPTWLKHLNALLMIPAMILFVASQTPTGRIKKTVKNPQLLGVKIWAIGHLAVNGDLASFLLFGTFLVWAVLLVINTNRRGNYNFPDQPSNLGDILAVVGGIVVWALFAFLLHERWFGVSVIA